MIGVELYLFFSWSTSDLRSQYHVTLTNSGRRELKGSASVRQAVYEARSGIVGGHIEIQELKMRGTTACVVVTGNWLRFQWQLVDFGSKAREIVGDNIFTIGNKDSCPWQHSNLKSRTSSPNLRRALLN